MHNNRLVIIKLVHTVIYFYMIGCLIYILFCCLTRTLNIILMAAIASILVEGLVLVTNKWKCPFTMLAEKYGDMNGSVTYLFLPDWLSLNTFRYSTFLFIGELLVLGFRYLSGV